MSQLTRPQRLEAVNAAILAISRHGRRFFHNKTFNRTSEIQAGGGGHLYVVDDYTGKRVHISEKGEWNGFSHGGTLRCLVLSFAEYIRTGKPLPAYLIGLQRPTSGSDIWGYGAEALQALKEDLRDCPVFEQKEKSEA